MAENNRPEWQVRQEGILQKGAAQVGLEQLERPLVPGSATPNNEGTGQSAVALGAEAGTLDSKIIATAQTDQTQKQPGQEKILKKKTAFDWLKKIFGGPGVS